MRERSETYRVLIPTSQYWNWNSVSLHCHRDWGGLNSGEWNHFLQVPFFDCSTSVGVFWQNSSQFTHFECKDRNKGSGRYTPLQNSNLHVEAIRRAFSRRNRSDMAFELTSLTGHCCRHHFNRLNSVLKLVLAKTPPNQIANFHEKGIIRGGGYDARTWQGTKFVVGGGGGRKLIQFGNLLIFLMVK